MSTVATALRKFITGATRVFHGAKGAFAVTVARWKSVLSTLSKKVHSLATKFASLATTRRIAANGEELVMLGRIEGREFTRMLRIARSAEAFEAAAGIVLSPAAKSSFRHLDDIATLHFPDVSIILRGEYVKRLRDVMIEKKLIKSAERVTDAETLERLIRADPSSLRRANTLLRKISSTRRLLYLGGAILVTGVGLSYLSNVVADYAGKHTGCFMYTRDLTNNVRKCRAIGCSCPLPLGRYVVPVGGGDRGSPEPSACDETDLWEKMRVRQNDCTRGTAEGRTEPFCVHCDWNETDPNSVDFVDKEKLQDNAYVRCEKIDALDAFNEVVGATVDDAFGLGSTLTNVAKDSLVSSVNVLPWIFGGAVLLVALVVVFYVWCVVRNAARGYDRSNEVVVRVKEHDEGKDEAESMEDEAEERRSLLRAASPTATTAPMVAQSASQ